MKDAETQILNKKFGCTIAIVLLLIVGYRWYFKHQYNWILLPIAAILLILALLKPFWLNTMRLVWDKIGHVLGLINTYILLTLFYFFILSPLSLIMRLTGADILKLKLSKGQDSYWEKSPKRISNGMKNQF